MSSCARARPPPPTVIRADLILLSSLQYNYLSTIFTIVYAVMQVPSTVIISKVRPSYWLFICELGASSSFPCALATTRESSY